jgi:hypothetical protein
VIEGVLRGIKLHLRAFFVTKQAIRAADEFANASHPYGACSSCQAVNALAVTQRGAGFSSCEATAHACGRRMRRHVSSARDRELVCGARADAYVPREHDLYRRTSKPRATASRVSSMRRSAPAASTLPRARQQCEAGVAVS